VQERVERWREAGFLGLGREAIELTGGAEFVQVQYEASDGDAEMRLLASSEGAPGKALQGESDGWVVGGFDPALLSPEIRLRFQGLPSGAEAPSIHLT